MIESLLSRAVERRPDNIKGEKRILFLVDDADAIRRQLEGEDLAWPHGLPLRNNISTDEITPARISDDVRDEIQRLAVAAHTLLGCRHLSRTDVMLQDGRPMLIETNTLPGFTGTSLLPQAAAEHGIPFGELVERLVAAAL